MQIIEDIFYTNSTIDLTHIIDEIKQREIIDEYTIFIIDNDISYYKYWKSHDCVILIDNDMMKCSNGKYLCSKDGTFEDFKKLCNAYDLLEKHINFTFIGGKWYKLDNKFTFSINYHYRDTRIAFNRLHLSINEFIKEILTNYPEFYKYDYSQIKPAIFDI
jgi:hypothetical protein